MEIGINCPLTRVYNFGQNRLISYGKFFILYNFILFSVEFVVLDSINGWSRRLQIRITSKFLDLATYLKQRVERNFFN